MLQERPHALSVPLSGLRADLPFEPQSVVDTQGAQRAGGAVELCRQVTTARMAQELPATALR